MNEKGMVLSLSILSHWTVKLIKMQEVFRDVLIRIDF